MSAILPRVITETRFLCFSFSSYFALSGLLGDSNKSDASVAPGVSGFVCVLFELEGLRPQVGLRISVFDACCVPSLE